MKRPAVITHEDRLLFAAKVDMSGGLFACWPWQGKPNADGYGRASMGGVLMYAHRVAYLLAVGELPDGVFACHTCDNPPCCNPAHLFAGTNADNMRDAAIKDRMQRGALSAATVSRLRNSVADLPERRAADIARDLGVSARTIYRARRRSYRPAVAA